METKTTYKTETVTKEVPLTKDSRIKSDKKGNYVTVEAWGSKKGANDCLERIIRNSYDLDAMGIKVYDKNGNYTKEFLKLEEAVMNANPSIYGDKNGKGGHKDHPNLDGTRHNKIIYTGDKIYLPDYSIETGETKKVPTGTKTVGTGKYEYVSTTPPSWKKTTTTTTVTLQEQPTQGPQGPQGEKGEKGDDGVGVKDIQYKDGKFIFTMTDGTEKVVDAGDLAGKDGKDGIDVKDIKIEGDKMIFIMSDGTQKEVPVAGLKGEDGVGIKEIKVVDGKMIFVMTDGSEQAVDASEFKGEKGDKGDKGDAGRGIEREWMEGEHRFVQYTDGTVVDLGDVVETPYESAVKAGFKGTKEDWEIMQLPLEAKRDDDGKLYWSYGGKKWATDETGAKVPCTGADGEIVFAPEQAKEIEPTEG